VTLLLKALGRGGVTYHGGRGKWTPGRWRTVRGDLVPCRSGLHYCRGVQIVSWLGPELWVFEDGAPDETIDHGDKMVTRRGRVTRRIDAWDERMARLFAADCAEHVLHLYEAEVPGDDRPRKAVEAARAYANGDIDDAAWAAARAARDAARDAAWDAARAARDRDAAWDAAWAARDAARDAAWAAAWAAAWDAARAAAWDAARAAEREWQYQRLLTVIGEAA